MNTFTLEHLEEVKIKLLNNAVPQSACGIICSEQVKINLIKELHQTIYDPTRSLMGGDTTLGGIPIVVDSDMDGNAARVYNDINLFNYHVKLIKSRDIMRIAALKKSQEAE